MLNFFHCFLFVRSSCICCAHSSAFPGVKKSAPFSRVTSLYAGMCVMTAGVPYAYASRSVIPNPSSVDGEQNIVAVERCFSIIFLSSTYPRNVMFSFNPCCPVIISNRSRSSPCPRSEEHTSELQSQFHL